MKRTLIDLNKEKISLPPEFFEYFSGADIYDSSCSPEARTFFVDKGKGYYLKSSRESLEREAKITEFFASKGLGASVVGYIKGDVDWLMTERIPGEDGTFSAYLDDPKWLCDSIAEALRALHSLDPSDCPIDRTAEYKNSVREGYTKGRYDSTLFLDPIFKNADEAYSFFKEHSADFKSDTLIHGDYCLPNIMFENKCFSGFIDLGNGGKGDRHIDIFWGAWTLRYNLKTDAYTDRFFDAYGREKVDMLMLKTVAAAEVFG